MLQLDLGESLGVDVIADLGQPIVGWGFDVDSDALKLARDATVVGPAWIGVSALDGDDLAGLTSPPGVSGTDVLLATFTIRALALGATQLMLGISGGDPSEGFALLEPGAFDSVSFANPLNVLVVPEPSTGWLLGGGLIALATRRRVRTR